MSGKPRAAAKLGAAETNKLKHMTPELARSLWSYDPVSGTLTWKIAAATRTKIGSVAGSKTRQGYLVVKFGYNEWFAHRMAWLITHGRWPRADLDHADTNKLNNSLANLREAIRRENTTNVGLRKDNTSGIKGVSFHKTKMKWSASISYFGKQRHLGYFITRDEAAAVYRSEAARLNGEFVRHE